MLGMGSAEVGRVADFERVTYAWMFYTESTGLLPAL